MSDGILLFTNDTGSGSAGGNAFDQSAFLDISLPPTSNQGFSSTVSNNPLGDFFANDFAPKYGAKELHFRDLQRVEDRSKWISGRPTYKIIWDQNFPGVDAYAYGNIQIRGTDECRYLECLDVGDGISVVGVISNVAWNLMPVNFAASSPAPTINYYVDGSYVNGVQTGYYFGIPASTGFNGGYFTKKTIFNYGYFGGGSDVSRNIHNYNIVSQGNGAIVLQAILVYFKQPGIIDCFAGTGFVNKSSVIASGTTLPYTGTSNVLGGLMSVFVNTAGQFGTTFSPVPSQSSIGIGSSGTNQLAVTIGTGASFPAGTGVYTANGSSYFLGYVASVSTDTLTLGTTLPFGVSNVISSICGVGSSFPVSASLFDVKWSHAFEMNHANMSASFSPNYILGSLVGSSPAIGGWTGCVGLYSFSDPALDYRITGFSMNFGYGSSFPSGLTYSLNGIVPQPSDTFGLKWGGATATLEIAGQYSALNLEFWVGNSAVLAATYCIDGFAYGSFNQVYSGPGKVVQTIVGYAGNGWHQVSFNPAGSTQVLLTKINAYKPKAYNGPSYGILADISVGQTMIRNVIDTTGQTYTAFGNITRIYPDNMALISATSAWVLNAGFGTGTTTAQNGGVNIYCPAGGSNASEITMQFYGKGFCVCGGNGLATSGATGVVTYNGVSTGMSLGYWINLGGPTVISVTVYSIAPSSGNIFTAIDILRDDTVINRQNFVPGIGLSSVMSYYNSPTEPLSGKPGDVWMQSPENSVAYQNIFGGWKRMNIAQPMASYAGSSQQALAPAGVSNTLLFNQIISDTGGYCSTPASGSTVFIFPSDGNYLVQTKLRYVEPGSSAAIGSVRYLSMVSGAGGARNIASAFGVSTGGIVTLTSTELCMDMKRGNNLSIGFITTCGVTLQTAGGVDGTFLNIQRIGP